jgi:hypothetical protein
MTSSSTSPIFSGPSSMRFTCRVSTAKLFDMHASTPYSINEPRSQPMIWTTFAELENVTSSVTTKRNTDCGNSIHVSTVLSLSFNSQATSLHWAEYSNLIRIVL